MTRHAPRGLILATAFAVAGCTKKNEEGGAGGGNCKPLTVTIDGQPIAGLGHGLGYVEAGGNYSLYVFNHDQATCEQLLAKSRQVPAGEESVGFGIGTYGPSIGYDANGLVGKNVEVELVKKPASAGDAMAMCVKATLPVKIGKNNGKTLVAEGRVDGKFCGERK